LENILIIAEAGVNHNGSLELAKKLALTAKECGADIVKFQTSKGVSSVVSKYAGMAEYQKENIGKSMSQKEMLKDLALTYEEFRELAAYCRKIGIPFLSTPFDLDSIDFLEELGCEMWKIPSGEITNLPYLRKIAAAPERRIILSTGMSNMDEIRAALSVLEAGEEKDITLLHCTTQYPTPYEDVNLRAMITMREELGHSVGYSDHTAGITIPIAAAAMGATVIEKHFTLDRNMEGPDHKASLEPAELKAMVAAIRDVEMAMGDGNKVPAKSELQNLDVVRRSIIAKKNIRKGEKLTEENITVKRPGTGINPMRWDEVLGTMAIRDFLEDELIEI
jgi:N,N'-diacetyllegionaminate synthase